MSTSSLFSNIYTPDELILNKTFGYWTAKWWQEFQSNDKNRAKQDVFFIAGKIREIPAQDKITSRHFTIQQHKPILMPVMNWLSVALHGETDSYLQRLATEKMDVVQDMSLTINGTKIDGLARRVKSPFFKLDRFYNAISDGYWVFWKPGVFGLGKHAINSFGCCSSGKTKIKIDYELDVVI